MVKKYYLQFVFLYLLLIASINAMEVDEGRLTNDLTKARDGQQIYFSETEYNQGCAYEIALLQQAKKESCNLDLKITFISPGYLEAILVNENITTARKIDLSYNYNRTNHASSAKLNNLLIAGMKGYLKTLKSLNLEGNHLGDQYAEGVAQLAQSGNLQGLEELNLRHNDISHMGLAPFTFIEGEQMPVLKTLYIDFNVLSDQWKLVEGEDVIGSILTSIPTLTNLYCWEKTGLSWGYMRQIFTNFPRLEESNFEESSSDEFNSDKDCSIQ